MRVLITNIEVSSFTGTVTVVRDLALGLNARGHEAIVFTHLIGPAGEELQRQGVRVVTDVDSVGAPPDVIHGHHNVPTVLALARFPGRPCVWWRHGLADWFDAPPRFHRIRRWMAVDEVRQHKLAFDLGAPVETVEILANGVDLARVPDRLQPLPAKPRKVLAFTKWSQAPHVPMLESTCLRSGLAFLAIGFSVGRVTPHPEPWLAQSDIVFASGRAALEALCCGAAVIAGDDRGMAGMVTSENFHALRRVNFGGVAMVRPMNPGTVEDEIRRFDARDARAVTRLARREADFRKLIDRLEAVYRDAIEQQNEDAWTPDDTRALNAFLAAWPQRVEIQSPWADWNAVRARLVSLRDANISAAA